MTFNVLFIIVLLNVIATITLWRTAARRPAKLKKKFLTALLRSEPIVPKHQPPKTLEGELQFMVSSREQQFFDDFKEFADVVNWWLANPDFGTPWRLQELRTPNSACTFRIAPASGGVSLTYRITAPKTQRYVQRSN
jgi:hypothetical protein